MEGRRTERDIQRKECSIRLWVCDDGLVPHQRCECGVEVQGVAEGFYGVGLCDVSAVVGEEGVVC